MHPLDIVFQIKQFSSEFPKLKYMHVLIFEISKELFKKINDFGGVREE